MKTRSLILFALLALGGCVGPMVQVTDTATVDPQKLQRAMSIPVFTLEAQRPKVAATIGEVTAYSCKNLVWQPPASKGNALTQLRIKALDLGAEAIVDVTFDTRGTDTFGTNCWETVQASGIAVLLPK